MNPQAGAAAAGGGILVISTVPSIGELLMSAGINLVVLTAAIFLAYYLVKRFMAGFTAKADLVAEKLANAKTTLADKYANGVIPPVEQTASDKTSSKEVASN